MSKDASLCASKIALSGQRTISKACKNVPCAFDVSPEMVLRIRRHATLKSNQYSRAFRGVTHRVIDNDVKMGA